MRQLRRSIERFGGVVLTATLAAAVTGIPQNLTAHQVNSAGEVAISTQVTQVNPAPAGDLSDAPRLSDDQLAALRQQQFARRDAIAARADSGRPPRSPGLPAVRGEPTQPPESTLVVQVHDTMNAFVVGRNNRNTIAANGKLVAEPSAVNDGIHVLYTGNIFVSSSQDGGQTWTDHPIPAGPPDAPIPCCDTDTLHDRARGVTFWSVLYLNNAPERATNGVVRIFIRPAIPRPEPCSYVIDPAGLADNMVPDYPHLGLTNNFLYLTTLNFRRGPDGRDLGTTTQVWRLNINLMLDCAPLRDVVVSTLTPTDGQGRPIDRAVVPVDGARDTIYWGMHEDATSFRVFKWPDSAPSPSSELRILSPSTFASTGVTLDCRGGNGDFSFTSGNAVDISGFRHRGAVGGGRLSFLWPVAPDAQHPQVHVHGVVFRESDLAVLAEPAIWHPDFCWAFPHVSANERGDLGLTIAAGGRAGGGGSAVRGFVGIDDEFTPGIGVFQIGALTADGTFNPPPGGRYGDYFSIRTHSPCGLFWVATNYALTGFGAGDVNARYVEFGRGRDSGCYRGWGDKPPTR